PLLDPAVQVLVNVGDAVLPNFLLPLRSRQLVFQNPAVAVQRRRLTGLLLQSHLRQEVFDAGADVGLLIFVSILPAVLVQVNPAVVVDVLLPRARTLLRGHAEIESVQERRQKNDFNCSHSSPRVRGSMYLTATISACDWVRPLRRGVRSEPPAVAGGSKVMRPIHAVMKLIPARYRRRF